MKYFFKKNFPLKIFGISKNFKTAFRNTLIFFAGGMLLLAAIFFLYKKFLPARPLTMIEKIRQESFTQEKFQNGLDILLTQKSHLIRGRKVALIVNQSSLTARGSHAIEEIGKLSQIVYVYALEHGLQGNHEAGKIISSSSPHDASYTSISLYGQKFSTPTLQELADIDVLIYDIQTTGDRFYTYISTLYRVLFLAKQSGVLFLVLDRPLLNPDRGILGAQLMPPWQSFVGTLPLPMHYALTNAELALLMNEEKFLNLAPQANLQVVPMQGYRRSMSFAETHSPWVAPSPNIKDTSTARVYSGMVLLEGSNLSEGRGSENPFLNIGAPFVNAKLLIESIPASAKRGFILQPIVFRPQSDFRARRPKYLQQTCYGISIAFDSQREDEADSVELTLAILWASAKLFPEFDSNKFLDSLWGSEILRMALQEIKTQKKMNYAQFKEKVLFENADFEVTRKKYFLYP